ncbi:MAG: ABC transporter substrate-binding protein [Cellulomonas sp.]
MRRTARAARSSFIALCVLVALGLAACSDSASPRPGRAGGEVEVFTWWAAGSEKLGLDALVGVFATQHPEYTFVNGAVAGGAGSAAKDLLQSRLQAHDPPDTFQAHAGKELTDYIEAGQLEDISALYDEFDLRKKFPSDLLRLLQVNGKIYSIPSNIHRSNMVWANPAVLTAAGLDPAATYDSIEAWFPALDAVKATGTTALSVATTWTQVNLLETVLMSDLGPDAYLGLWDRTTDWKSAEVTHALTDFSKLMSYTNPDRDGLDWTDSTQLVIDGGAAYNVMGDWAVAAFEEQKKVAGTDYSYFAVPGSADQFGFVADSFTLPVGAPNPDGAKAWLDSVGSLAGQTAFNRAKGSIPARTDANPADFSEYQQSAIEAFGRAAIVPSLAHGAAASITVLTAISAATSTYTTGASDLATYQSALAAAAS